MRRHLRAVLYDPALATRLRENGLRIIRERHSCSHRTRELLDIYDSIKQPTLPARRTEAA
jgi:spore maturation protein CgeB